MVDSIAKNADESKIEKLVDQLLEIQLELRHNLANLQKKLAPFDSKPNVLSSLEGLKKETETKAGDLEAEVKRLRAELKAVRELLGSNGSNSKNNHV
jgi:hypothetical protein